jgi:hypothetical protein
MGMKRYLLFILVANFLSPASVWGDDAKKLPQFKNLPKFDSVDLGGVGDLYIKQTDDEGLTVSAEDALAPLIKVSVSNKILYLNLADAGNHTQAKIKYYLFVKDLKKISANTASSIFIPGGFKSDSLQVSLSGLGEAEMSMTVKTLDVRIDGGSKLIATGTADTQKIVIDGAGEFNGVKLTGKSADVKVSGSAVAKTYILGSLNVRASADSIVKYCGHSTLTKEVSEHGFVAPGSLTDCH